MSPFQSVRLLSVIICILISSTGCKKGQGFSLGSTDTIKIGEVQTMTGSEATFGIAIHRGIKMVIDQVNANGGIHGKKIELVTLDDQGKSEESATAITKLITQNGVTAILGSLASSRSMAMAPIAQNSKIPMISPAATNPKVTELGNYIFRVCFIDPFQGRVMAKFALNELKVKKVAIIRDLKSDYSIGLSDYFADTLKKGGGEVLPIQSYSTGDIDFKAQLTAIRGQKPDALFIPGYYTEAGLIIRQARELGIKVPLLGGDGWSSPKLVEIAGNDLENSYFSNHYSNEDQSPQVQAFVKDFQRSFGSLPDGIAALGYDAALVLTEAMKRSKSIEPTDIRNALAETKNFSGATGLITMDANRNPIKSAVVLRIHNGENLFFTRIMP